MFITNSFDLRIVGIGSILSYMLFSFLKHKKVSYTVGFIFLFFIYKDYLVILEDSNLSAWKVMLVDIITVSYMLLVIQVFNILKIYNKCYSVYSRLSFCTVFVQTSVLIIFIRKIKQMMHLVTYLEIDMCLNYLSKYYNVIKYLIYLQVIFSLFCWLSNLETKQYFRNLKVKSTIVNKEESSDNITKLKMDMKQTKISKKEKNVVGNYKNKRYKDKAENIRNPSSKKCRSKK